MSLVEIHGINKSYGSVQVLKDVTLDIAKGEVVAVIGRSGSGKSTMLRCINGLEPIQAGVIRVDGTQVNDPATNLRKLRQEVGIVFQSFNLFPHLSVCDNITLAPRVVKKQAPQELVGGPTDCGDRGDTEPLEHLRSARIVDACHHAFNPELLAGDARRDDVRVVPGGDSSEGVRLLDARL